MKRASGFGRRALHEPLLIQLLQVAESVGSDECYDCQRGIIGNVNQETRGYGTSGDPRDSEHYANDKYDKYWSPRESELHGVQKAKPKRGGENSHPNAQTPGQYWIKKSAKKQLFHERAEADGKQRSEISFHGAAEELIDGHPFGNRQEMGDPTEDNQKKRTKADQASYFNIFMLRPIPSYGFEKTDLIPSLYQGHHENKNRDIGEELRD
jgi:hypothetical protein